MADDAPDAADVPAKAGLPKVVIFGPAALGVLVPLAIYLATKPAPPTADERFAKAFEYLDTPAAPGAWAKAREIAETLEGQGYRSPEFGGGLEYIRGIVAVRHAMRRDEFTARPYYVKAVRALRAAEQLAIVDERRAEWEYALGIALARLDEPDAAEPYLRAALRDGWTGREQVGTALIEAILSRSDRPVGDEIVSLGEDLFENATEGPARDAAGRLLVELHLRRGRQEDAAAVLGRSEASEGPESRFLAGRIALGRGETEKALKIFHPLAAEHGVPRAVAAGAGLLAGRIEETLGSAEAVGTLDRVARNHAGSEEAIAAALSLGGLMQQAGRHEEASYWFRLVLAEFSADPRANAESFRNRWVGRAEIAAAIVAAWESWVATGHAAEAEAIAADAEPAIGPRKSAELVARTHRDIADRKLAEAEAGGAESVESARAKLAALRRRSGRAYVVYAGVVDGDEAAAAYREAAIDLRRSGDADEALTAVEAFLEVAPKGLRASGELLRAEALMDLGDFEAAVADLDRIIEIRRDDPVVFRARLLAGRCARELGDGDAAERLWQSLVTSGELRPTAAEWRAALYELAMLREQRAAAAEDADRTPRERADAWDAAVETLTEFVRRYPDDPQAPRTALLAATALRRRAAVARVQRRAAETDNVRQRLDRLAIDRLVRAEAVLADAVPPMAEREDRSDLGRAGRELLRGAFFERAHVLLELGRSDDAISAYGAAINRYPDDPRVFTAYVRMAEAHRQLGRELEARAVLGQARVILRRMDANAFGEDRTNYLREEWSDWLERAGS